jgi:glucose/arabinose dehydrogenase
MRITPNDGEYLMRYRLCSTLLLCLYLHSFGYAQTQYDANDAFPRLPSFSGPIEMVERRDGSNKMYVAEQRGKIYVFDRNPNVSTRKLFLDISATVSQVGSETGLLGLAFHPDYKYNGYFYVNYTSSVAGKLQSFVSRFQTSATDPDSADRASELILLTVDQTADNHNGGNVRFGPDQYLYLTFGDGGGGGDYLNNSQSRGTLLGKILRIDVNSPSNGKNYSIPPSNPYAGNTAGMREEIYAYGFRNPWKISFDRSTGTLWAGDVGQNLWEEIDTIRAGGNYGWHIMEGNICFEPSSGCDTTGLTMPLWVYYHSGGNKSITGGYVYRGSALPGLYGKYIYGDYGSGNIWALSFDANGAPVNQLIIHAPVLISAFGEDRDGELYVVSYFTGRLLKLQQPGTNTESDDASIPVSATLDQNYPNPFNPSTTILYQTPQRAFVTLRILNVLGQEIQKLVEETQDSGDHHVQWEAGGLPSGTYFYQLRVGAFVITKSMVLLR